MSRAVLPSPGESVRPAAEFGARVEGWSAAEWTLSRKTEPGEVAPLPGRYTPPASYREAALADRFPPGNLVPATRFGTRGDDPEWSDGIEQAPLGAIQPLPERKVDQQPNPPPPMPGSAAQRLGRQRLGQPQDAPAAARKTRTAPRHSLSALAEERRRR
ncbi:MAG: hypothetical protein K2W91_06775 [Novosphingobium sp.]|nr:hypothetical protein [Novosphingobium sp.]